MEFSYQPKNSTHRFLRVGFGVLALFIIAVLIFNQQIRSSFSALSNKLQSSQCSAYNSTETIFSEHHEYQNWSQAADPLWDQLIPANGGFIVDESKSESSIYGLAMFHQLHCVQMIRNDFQELYARLDGRSDGHSNVLHHLDELHLLHCLDYLRQVSAPLFKWHAPLALGYFQSTYWTSC